MDDTFAEKSTYVHMPVSEYGEEGLVVYSGIVYLMQRSVLKREVKPGDLLNVIISDEFPNIFNSYHSRYVAESRSHLGGMLVAGQGLDSYLAAIKSMHGKHLAGQFLAQARHKVFHTLASAEDGEFASRSIGSKMQPNYTGHVPGGKDVFEAVLGQERFSGGFNTSVRPVCEPRLFLTGLRTGGPENDCLVDAVIVKSGTPFKTTGDNWLRTSFKQR